MKSFLIIGAGKFGRHLCKYLSEQGNEIMLVDRDEEKMADLLQYVTSARIGDCTHPEVMRTFGINNFDACLVCINEDFQASLEITDLLKEMGAKLVIGLARTDIQAKFLLRNGADQVVYPDRDVAQKISVSISSDNIFDYIFLSDECSIFEIAAPAGWIGKTIGEVNVRARYRISIVAVKRQGKILSVPGIDYLFKADEHLVVMGKKEDVQQISK